MSRILIRCLTSLLLIGTASIVYAQSIKFYSPNLPPWGFEENGIPQGVVYDTVNAIATEAGVKIRHEIRPLNRLMRHMEQGAIDCAVLLKTPEVEEKYVPVAQVAKQIKIGVMTKADLTVASLKDLKGRTVARPRGGDAFDKAFEENGINLYTTSHDRQSMLLLKEGTVDAAFGSLTALQTNARAVKLDTSDLGAPYILGAFDGWMWCTQAFAKNNQSVLDSLGQAAQKLLNSGQIKKILERYINP